MLYTRRKCSLSVDHGRLLFRAFRRWDAKGTVASPFQFADDERRSESEAGQRLRKVTSRDTRPWREIKDKNLRVVSFFSRAADPTEAINLGGKKYARGNSSSSLFCSRFPTVLP